MTSFVDFHLQLIRVAAAAEDAPAYTVAARMRHTTYDAVHEIPSGEQPRLALPGSTGRETPAALDDLGRRLGQGLFGLPAVDRLFRSARAHARGNGVPLRLRLQLPPELQALPWESMAPEESGPLILKTYIYFSRYASSDDERPLRLQEPDALRAAIMVADPQNLDPDRFARPDVERIVDEFAIPFVTAPARYGATARQIVQLLRDAPDVFYLAAHATIDGATGEAALLLENENGAATATGGDRLVTLFRQSETPPRMVVLASPAGADKETASAPHAVLGSRLIEAGVPAVLVLPGALSTESAAFFLQTFFGELESHATVDRAVAIARQVMNRRSDARAPILLTRLKNGRLWETGARPPAGPQPALRVVEREEEAFFQEGPDADDDAAWQRIWQDGQQAADVGRDRMEQDERYGPAVMARLRGLLRTLIDRGRLRPVRRLEAGDALAALGDDRPGVCTMEPLLCEPIPAGTLQLRENGQEREFGAFQIGKYPVTNAQFRLFIDDGGYEDKTWWKGEGRYWLLREQWRAPRHWDAPRHRWDNQPVAGVSMYEAEAYAAWLSARTGRFYRLPTETEWERAAGHTDGRAFPWGDAWDEDRANTVEEGLGRPSAVGMFPRGAAPCGALDMSGNVVEWTTSRYRPASRVIVWRGGSFNTDRSYARVGLRDGGHRLGIPNLRLSITGFRLVSPLTRRPHL